MSEGKGRQAYSKVMFAPSLQNSIVKAIDIDLAEAIADVVGTSGQQVMDDLWELSVLSRILKPEDVDAGPTTSLP